MNNLRSSGRHMIYLSNEVSVQKSNYFLNVNYSIPGVGSGKLVYKYSVGHQHHFSPQTFESPIIAVLDGSRWIITAPNGDRYEFLPNPSSRKNGNLRTHKYRKNISSTGYYYSSLQENNIEPREVVTDWYCAKITNPFSTDAIFFKGKSYGAKIDFFSHWRQDALKGLPFNSAYSGQPQYFQGFIITSIESSIESLDLIYEEID